MKPCPFCGSTTARVAGGGPIRWVECGQCSAQGPAWTDDDTMSDEENDAATVAEWDDRERGTPDAAKPPPPRG